LRLQQPRLFSARDISGEVCDLKRTIMPYYQRRIYRKEELERIGGTTPCVTWTPLGVTWYTSASTEGGEILHSEKNPDWRRDIAQGRSATTTFLANEIEIDFTHGYVEARRLCTFGSPATQRWASEKISGYVNDGFSDVTLPSVAPEIIDLDADARARQDFIRRARNAQGAFRGSTFLAELADTLRTIRRPAAGLRSSVDEYSSVARRRIHKAIGRDPRGVRAQDLSKRQSRAANRALSDSWLEAQFGWLPLISDIGEAVEGYNRFSKRQLLERIGSDATNVSDPVHTFHGSTSRCMNFRTEVLTSSEYLVRYYGAVKCNMRSFPESWCEEAGFRVRDFVPALWEWIPYSFLVDYFTNIGEMIEAASFPRSDLAWAARTFVNVNIRDGSRMTGTKISSNPYPSNGYTEVLSFYPSAIKIRRKFVSRTNYTGSFVPSLQLEIPGFRNYKRWLNIAALANLRGMKR